MTRRPTEADVVLLRAGSGTIHLGVPLGRGYDTMCCRLTSGPTVRAYDEAAAAVYLTPARERYLCDECCQVADRPWPVIQQITGW